MILPQELEVPGPRETGTPGGDDTLHGSPVPRPRCHASAQTAGTYCLDLDA